MREEALRAEALAVGYGGKPVLSGITFSVQRGEVFTLIGPNAAGKTTLLRSLAGQLPRLSGEILLAGRPLSDYSRMEIARKMAVLLTDRARPELMTCGEVAASGRYPHTGRFGRLSAADRQEAEAAMEAVGVSALRERSFGAVSDGQRQRVLLARALCQRPEVLLLDEPCSFLDVRHKLELLGLVRSLARERNMTVIMTLHEIDLAQKVSDRVLAVKDGQMAACGAPEKFFTPEGIRGLYGLTEEVYDPCFGSLELPGAKGEPQVFVLSGGGKGIPLFRRLQREGVPFAAGILYTNDVDWRLARMLAAEVVEEQPFRPISEEAMARALALVRKTPRFLDAEPPLGQDNACLRELAEEAKRLGKYERGEALL